MEVAHLIMDRKQRQEGPGEESCSQRNSPNGLLPLAELHGPGFLTFYISTTRWGLSAYHVGQCQELHTYPAARTFCLSALCHVAFPPAVM